MKNFIICVLITSFISPIRAQFEKFGLDGIKITCLAVSSDRAYSGKFILAGTDSNGLFMRKLVDTEEDWLKFGFDGRTITSCFVQQRGIGPAEYSTIFVGLESDITLYDSTLIYKNDYPIQSFWSQADSSLNREEVKRVVSFYGFDYSGHEPPQPVFCCAENSFIYCFQHNHWEKIWSGPEYTILRSLCSSNGSIWAGGAIHAIIATLLILKSTDMGQNWEEIRPPFGEIYSCYSLASHINNVDLVYAGLNSAVIKTIDGGKNWNLISFNPSTTFYGLAVNSLQPNHVLAGGSNNMNQFILFESRDGGDNWKEFVPDSNIAGITCMLGTILNDEYMVFIGTEGNGVYRFRTKITDIEDKTNENHFENKFLLYQNYPNPFNTTTNIHFSLPEYLHVKIEIYNLMAKKILLLLNEEKEPGHHVLPFNAGHLSSGIYICKIQAGDLSESIKLLLFK